MYKQLIGYRPCEKNPQHKASIFISINDDTLGYRNCYYVECPCGFMAQLSWRYDPECDPEFIDNIYYVFLINQ